jgi:hypothetical protein
MSVGATDKASAFVPVTGAFVEDRSAVRPR